ncbi:MAG: tetratricopeptide repeat protein [Deltaproteobacteria bacterium]|nr:tetratricopeptide repeat protein [Deltaproteobacteria bacterium]
MAWPDFTFILVLPTEAQLSAEERRLFSELPAPGRWEEAKIFFSGLLAVRPDLSPAANALALVAYAENDYATALTLLLDLRHREPQNPDWLNNLGLVAAVQGDLIAARACFALAVKTAPNNPEIYYNQACVEIVATQPEAALAGLRRVLALREGHAKALFALSRLAKENGLVGEALAACRRLLALFPESATYRFDLGLMLLKTGAWREGLALYEERFRVAGIPPVKQEALWQGEDCRGKTMLVEAEQGLGDSLNFVRYLSWLQGAKVCLRVPKPLLKLMQSSFADLHVIDMEAEIPACDFQVPLLSLPFRFGTTPENLPAEVPYLFPAAARREYWRKRLAAYSDRVRIGIVWGSNPINIKEKRRAIPPELFARLLEVSGVFFFGLKKEQSPEDEALTAALPAEEPSRFIDLAPELADLQETAAIMENLDLIITCDTSIPHLAGALARPVWLLLPFDADWRWLLERDDSPWYPTMRLFRQPAPGAWEPVLAEVRRELRQLAG